MTLEKSIELFTVINLSVVGLSHFLQPANWVRFFQTLSAKEQAGNIFNALLALTFGSFVFCFHIVWQWPAMLVTVYGLAQIIKGFIYLLFPLYGLGSIKKVVPGMEGKFKWVGLIMFLLAAATFYLLELYRA